MRQSLSVGSALVVTLLSGCGAASEPPWSGLAVGQNVAAFDVLNVSNAEQPGKNGTKACLVWQSGGKAVAMIFTREINDPLIGLIKQLDAEVARVGQDNLAAIIVVLSNDESMEGKLKALAANPEGKNVSLALLENESGPPSWHIAKDAAVTATLYQRHKTIANHAFRKGEFNDEAVAAIVKDLPKISQ